MEKLTINEELKNLLPPLSAEEYAGLEGSILADGCLSPLIVWNGILVDGHKRYEICVKHKIPFSHRDICFGDLNEAKFWAWKHQEHRRNLTPYQRVEMVMKCKEVIAIQVRKRLGRQNDLKRNVAHFSSTRTNEVLGDMAGLSGETVRKAEFVVTHADEETKQRLRNGEKGVTINSEYCRLKAKVNGTPVTKSTQKLEKEEQAIPLHKSTSPEKLTDLLIDNFSLEYLQQFVKLFTGELLNRYCNDSEI